MALAVCSWKISAEYTVPTSSRVRYSGFLLSPLAGGLLTSATLLLGCPEYIRDEIYV